MKKFFLPVLLVVVVNVVAMDGGEKKLLCGSLLFEMSKRFSGFPRVFFSDSKNGYYEKFLEAGGDENSLNQVAEELVGHIKKKEGGTKLVRDSLRGLSYNYVNKEKIMQGDDEEKILRNIRQILVANFLQQSKLNAN